MAHRTNTLRAIPMFQPASVLTRVQHPTQHPAPPVMVRPAGHAYRVADLLAREAFVMAASDLINLPGLIDNAKCFALVRQHRWPESVRCPVCGSGTVIRDGCDNTQPCRQRCRCKACSGRFDDLTGTVLAGHHQPLRVWVLCLPFMGLNLSNRQIAGELGLAACRSEVASVFACLGQSCVAGWR